MSRILEIAEDLWTGRLTTAERHPVTEPLQELAELGRGVAFVSSFANVTAVETDAGLVLIDVGGSVVARQVHEIVRAWSSRPLHTAVYTHGHIDHVFGVPLYEEEARRTSAAPPRVVAHEAVVARFDRYRLSAGYNQHINARQFGLRRFQWPTDYRYPDLTYRDRLELPVGGEDFELFHDRGETDDATWVWAPDRRVLFAGDMFIWASPNCGNPQKVQRYPREWAQALRTMSTLGAETLCPGHGFPVLGRERVAQALGETAELLESLHDQTLAMMNAGACLDEILHTVRAPAHLLARPYLRPVYDQPEFIVRNVWRLYGGWYDGNPAQLEPASDAALAHELATLAGGAPRLATRARDLADRGELALACHLAELALRASPHDAAVREVRCDVYRRRADAAQSTMARGIYRAAAEERSE